MMDHALLHEQRSPSHPIPHHAYPQVRARYRGRWSDSGLGKPRDLSPYTWEGKRGDAEKQNKLDQSLLRQPMGTSRWLLDLAEIDTSGNVPEVTHALTHRRS